MADSERVPRSRFTTVLSGRRDNERLGTFIGVFTPSILTILGVILYLRTGWMVGNVGLVPALAIVAIANAVTLVTAFSVSAVATNMRVGPGGAYYIISRSLGIEWGVAIGIPLFLAMTFSVTLYSFGLAESIAEVWPAAPQRPIAALTVLAVTVLAARGAGVALKLQLPILLGIGLSLIALLIGATSQSAEAIPLWSGIADPVPFWGVFAVFFPAVTGFMAGVSLSGDLKKPARSIPLGSVAAVLTGFVVYLVIPVALALAASSDQLASNNLIWFDIAGPLAFLIFWGIWGAIFSSAVGSVLGAPRTLEAMVDDHILPKALGRSFGPIRGPGIPLLFTAALALVGVALGDLQAIAPLLTMFFLTTYGTVNLVAGIEKLSGDPSYRPTLRVPWWLSLAGAAGCFFVMFLINPLALLIAVALESAVYMYIRRRQMKAPWGDLRRGALLSLIRSSVIQLRRLPDNPRNWRPNIMVFAGEAGKRPDLVRFAEWLGQDRGILTVSELRVGKLEDYAARLAEETAHLNDWLEEIGVTAFGEIDVVEDFEDGAVTAAQANGIAGIESNTVVFGWSDKPERQASVLRVVERLALLQKSVVICRIVPRDWNPGHRTIHVWWGGLQHNGDMLVLFAHLISLNPVWRDAEIVIFNIATSDMTAGPNRRLLERITSASRIPARTEVIVKPPDRTVQEVIWEHSAEADVVLLGLRESDDDEVEAYAARVATLLEGLPSVLLVRNAGAFRGQLLGDLSDEPVDTLE